MKTVLREKAIALRRQGKTYREILVQIPVSKSTLSLWLRSVSLSTPQVQRITRKRVKAALRGAQKRRANRILQVHRYESAGADDVGILSKRDVWLIATTLYWAEGSKQNQRSPSAQLVLGNTDFRILKIFSHWLYSIGVQDDKIIFELYVHDSRRDESEEFRRWWANKLSIKVTRIDRVYFKKGNPQTARTNVGDLYHGLLRIKVRMSTHLNRQIHGWIAGIGASLGDGVTGNTSAFEAEDSRIVP